MLKGVRRIFYSLMIDRKVNQTEISSSQSIQFVHKSIFGCGKCIVEIHPVTFTEHSWHGVVVCYHISALFNGEIFRLTLSFISLKKY